MPNGAAPAGSAVGDVASSVRLPPSTANAADRCSTRLRRPRASCRRARAGRRRRRLRGERRAAEQCQRPVRGDRVAGDAAAGGVDGEQVLAVVADLDPAGRGLESANGEAPIEVSAPLAATAKAETVPLPAPPWAFETNSWVGLVGRNSLPNGPRPCAANGEPGAAVSLPPLPTAKLSISEVFDAGADEAAAVAVEEHVAGLASRPATRRSSLGSGRRCPPAVEREAGVVAAAVAGVGDVDEVFRVPRC